MRGIVARERAIMVFTGALLAMLVATLLLGRFTLRNVLVIALAQLVSSLAFSRMSRRFSVLKSEVDELLKLS